MGQIRVPNIDELAESSRAKKRVRRRRLVKGGNKDPLLPIGISEEGGVRTYSISFICECPRLLCLGKRGGSSNFYYETLSKVGGSIRHLYPQRPWSLGGYEQSLLRPRQCGSAVGDGSQQAAVLGVARLLQVSHIYFLVLF